MNFAKNKFLQRISLVLLSFALLFSCALLSVGALDDEGSTASSDTFLSRTISGDDNGIITNKVVSAVPGKSDEFLLSLESFATGSSKEITVTKPADIVLVLDHSGSMRTPVGASRVLNSGEAIPENIKDTFISRAKISVSKGKHRGYYVAQDTRDNQWYIMEHSDNLYGVTEGTKTGGWIAYEVNTTESIVETDPEKYTEHTDVILWAGGTVPNEVIFYKSQYAMLYDAVLAFVDELQKSGIEHNVTITGFAGNNSQGSRLYVGLTGSDGVITDVVKAYKSAMYHENTTPERREYLYQQSMKNVQNPVEYAELLNNIHSIETNHSFTCPAIGLQIANEVLEANPVDLEERDRIVVLFTDGIPNVVLDTDNYTETNPTSMYNEIVSKAAHTKSDLGATVYSISTSTLGTGDRTFLSYISSDYPNAVNYEQPNAPIAQPAYTKQVNVISDMDVAFATVTEKVSSTQVTLDNATVMLDVLSDYFDLTDAEVNVSVFTQTYDGQGDWGAKEDLSTKVVTMKSSAGEGGRVDQILVSGFDYAEEYISDVPRTKTVTVDGVETTIDNYYGSKIVVEVTIKTREGFWGGNNVPTNDSSSGIYVGEERVDKFPVPQVNVPVTPEITTKDQVVYYSDGTIKAEHVLDQVKVGGVPVVYDAEAGKFVPGLVNDPSDDWMDDFVTLNWSSGSCTLDTAVSSTEEKDYTFGVTLLPLSEGTDDSNIPGVAISPDGISVSSTGHVDILVPVLTYHDSTINLGDETADDYYNAVNFLPGVTWVYQDNYPQVGTPTMGEEPKLSYHYTPEGVGSSYFTGDTPVNVTVSIGELDITEISYFEWEHCYGSLHDEPYLSVHKGNEDSFEFYIHLTYLLSKDVVVIDFGLPVDIHVFTNDFLPEGVVIEGVMLGQLPEDRYTEEAAGELFKELAGQHGTVTVSDSVIRYTPSDMNMSVAETFVYAVKYDSGNNLRYYYASVTVVPAANIYYEDSFLTFVDSAAADTSDDVKGNGEWIEVGTAADKTQAEDRPGADLEDALGSLDADNVYGYDDAYSTFKEYSLGSAYQVTIDKITGGVNAAPKAIFTFTGTGFDVVGLTDSCSGAIWVKVTDQNGKQVKSYVVSTYYGYTYDANTGEWTPVSEGSGNALYQVPVIKVTDLSYGTYNVEIKGVYLSSMDPHYSGAADAVNEYTVWLDAIRIYNPAANDSVSNGFYELDGENNPWFTPVKNLLTNPDTFDQEGTLTDGIMYMYIDGIDGDVVMSEYADPGPNNETYLKNGHAVAFRLLSNHSGDTAPDIALQIGAKLASGSSAVLQYNGKTLQTLNTAVNMFYKLGELSWEKVTIEDVSYWISSPVVLSCSSGDSSILSLTDIKVTGTDATSIRASDSDDSADQTVLEAVFDNEVADYVDSVLGTDEATLTAKFGSLSLMDEVVINIYFEAFGLDGISESDIGMLMWSSRPDDGAATFENAEKVISGCGYSSKYNLNYCVTDGIAAKKLGDDIFFRVYAKLPDGTYVYSRVIKYSPKIYAMDRLENSSNENMKALCVAMLNYGAAAQQHFGYKTDALMNADLTAEHQSLVTDYSSDMVTALQPVDAKKAGVFGTSVVGFSERYPSVSFEGAFSVNYYFTPSMKMQNGEILMYGWSAADFADADVLTTANATFVTKMVRGSTGTYRAEFADIVAKCIDSPVYVCAVYTGEDGTVCTTGVIPYSVSAYCVDRMEYGETDTMKALAEYTVVYGYYAKRYFG